MAKSKTKINRLSQFWFVWNIVEAIILFVGGTLAIVAGAVGQSKGGGDAVPVEHAVAYVVSAFVILDGLLRIVMHLAKYEKNDDDAPMVIAGFEISIGILFILLQAKYNSFTYTIVNLVCILMMVIGVLLLVYAIFFIAKKLSKLFMPILEILFSAILVGVGITIEVLYNTEDSKDQVVLIMIGSILVIAAIAMFVIAIITRKKRVKETIKAEEESATATVEIIEPNRKRISDKPKKDEVVVAEEKEPEESEPLQIEDEKE